jgi:hypothetical protein
MRKTTILLSPLMILALSSPAWATGVTYDITVNTSSISGTTGSLDFQFNPGPLVTQAANLQILGFTTDGMLGSATPSGDVTGTLPGTLTFDNLTSFNDYFTGFTYGNTLSFDVNLYGPAVTTPDGVSTSGSTFAFFMFSDAAGTMPVLTTDPGGTAATVDINLDGSTTPTNSSAQLTITNPSAPVPEPASFFMLAAGMAGVVLFRKHAGTVS